MTAINPWKEFGAFCTTCKKPSVTHLPTTSITAYQMSITGDETYVGNDTIETKEILRTFPASGNDKGMFFFIALKRRSPWVAQLSEDKQNELRAFLRNIQSLDRRLREAITEFGV